MYFFAVPSISGLFALGAVIALAATGNLKAVLWIIAYGMAAVVIASHIYGYLKARWSGRTE